MFAVKPAKVGFKFSLTASRFYLVSDVCSGKVIVYTYYIGVSTIRQNCIGMDILRYGDSVLQYILNMYWISNIEHSKMLSIV